MAVDTILGGPFLRAAAAATVAVGAGILPRGVGHAVLACRSARWPKVTGQIDGIEYRTFRQTKGEPWREFKGKDVSRIGRRAALRFYYRYTVGDQDFQGHVLFFGSDEVGLGPADIRSYGSRFATGRKAAVYFITIRATREHRLWSRARRPVFSPGSSLAWQSRARVCCSHSWSGTSPEAVTAPSVVHESVPGPSLLVSNELPGYCPRKWPRSG